MNGNPHIAINVKISKTLQPLIDATRGNIPSLLKQLQVGQTVQAKVLAQLQPNLVRLQIATTELLARTPMTLRPGTKLQLEVTKGQPLPELRIVRQPDMRDHQMRALKSAMSQQLPPDEIRQAVRQMRPEVQQSPRHAELFRQLSNTLQNAGLRWDQINPAQLQRALSLSGLYHEANLAAGQPANPADAKVQLLNLLNLLRGGIAVEPKGGNPALAGHEAQVVRQGADDGLISRMIRLVEASIARIQLQQAGALPVDEQQRQAWQIDLPIKLPDETHETRLRIERERREDNDGAKAPWAVNLAFEFDTIGTLQCRIGLAGDRVSATFWSERALTHNKVEAGLPDLQTAFEAQGLEVVHLAGVLGDPPEPMIHIPRPDGLVDERA